MIVITGAAGFIGSNTVAKLNAEGYQNLILVDDFADEGKAGNLEGKKFLRKINRDTYFEWFENNHAQTEFVFHLGARTDTTEFDVKIFEKLNLGYSVKMWEMCSKYKIPLLYASSAATYGMGEYGYDDNHDVVDRLKPLNPYGESKNDFDKWALNQNSTPPFWAGIKFFNVFGPNEYHKGRMASVVLHAFRQITETRKMKLFKSHNSRFKDGEQQRDFIYVKDVTNVLFHFMLNRDKTGLFNLGTGKARTFSDLVKATFKAMGMQPDIEFIDTPKDIRDKYQYYTEANMKKLGEAGYRIPFLSLEQGVTDYVKQYLLGGKYM